MTVYVDDVRHPFGRYVMCHMWADTREELFAMADKIGVQRKWFQRPNDCDAPKPPPPGMHASWEHFDITITKKKLALDNGALLTDMFGPMFHCAKLRGNEGSIRGVLRSRSARGWPADGVIRTGLL